MVMCGFEWEGLFGFGKLGCWVGGSRNGYVGLVGCIVD